MTKEEKSQFMESLGTLKQMASPDEGIHEITEHITKYRYSFCEALKKRIKYIIDYLCKYTGDQKQDFCDNNIYNIISALCKYYKLYRKYCCYACCSPKIPEWGLIVMNLNTINQYLNPEIVNEGINIELPDLEVDVTLPDLQLKVCERLKDTLNQLVYIICKYREQNLCGDNELTRSITKLCKIYPYFRERCCRKT
jgi:hypothetical protein